jgi:hypothetical protein
MLPYQETTAAPGQIEAALQFLRFAEEIRSPKNYSSPSVKGRKLSKTEFEVMDSALTLLLEYFNQPPPVAAMQRSNGTESTPANSGEI